MKKLLALFLALAVTAAARYVTIPEQAEIDASLHSQGNDAYALATNAQDLLTAEYWFGVADALWDSEAVTYQIYTEDMASLCDWCVNYSNDHAYNATNIYDQTYWVGRAAGYAAARDFCSGY